MGRGAAGALRFTPGERVLCRRAAPSEHAGAEPLATGEAPDGWEAGRVTQVWPSRLARGGRHAPYQVLLLDGRYVYPPADAAEECRVPLGARERP